MYGMGVWDGCRDGCMGWVNTPLQLAPMGSLGKLVCALGVGIRV